LGEKAKVKETVRLYSKVWQLPTFKGILAIIALAVIIAATLSTVLRVLTVTPTDPLLTFFLYLSVLAIPSFVGTGLLYAIVRKEGSPLDLRRTFGSVQFGVLFWMAFGVIGSIVSAATMLPYYEIRMWMLGLGLAYLAFAFLVTGLSDHHPIRNFLAALMIPMLWYALMIGLSSPSADFLVLPTYWWLVAIITYGAFSVAVHYIFHSVSKPFQRDLGIDGPELLRAFGYDYLMDNSVPIETTLTKISTKQDIPVEIMVIKDNEDLIAVGVMEYVHPGPFRDIGSSGLPSAIMRHVGEKYGVPAFVMHAACTHQQNLTTKEDFPIVLAEIDRLIEETEVHQTISGPHWNDLGKFKVWTTFVGPDLLTISTSAPDFTDDIALEVGMAAADEIRKRLPELRSVSVVDAHNCIDDEAVSVVEGDPEAETYMKSLADSAVASSQLPRNTVEIGAAFDTTDQVSEKEGLGPGGVTALVIRTSGKETVLVSVDGNNMEPGYRDRSIAALKEAGFDDAELLTTDTHLVNAISLSSRGYPPVGQHKPDIILDLILDVASKAKENVKPAQVGIGQGMARGLRTFGEKGFDILTQDIAEAAGIAKRIGIAAAGSTFLLVLLTTFLF
jgi:putative membrane protein